MFVIDGAANIISLKVTVITHISLHDVYNIITIAEHLLKTLRVPVECKKKPFLQGNMVITVAVHCI